MAGNSGFSQQVLEMLDHALSLVFLKSQAFPRSNKHPLCFDSSGKYRQLKSQDVDFKKNAFHLSHFGC